MSITPPCAYELVWQVLAVALGQAVYLWNAATGSIEHLLTLPDQHDFVTRLIRYPTHYDCGASIVRAIALRVTFPPLTASPAFTIGSVSVRTYTRGIYLLC